MRLQNQPTVDSATRIILTDEGSSYFFSRRQRLERFRLINGRDEYGLQLREYRPETLYKLISGGLVRKLQYPVVDALTQREEVVRYITTLAHGVLSKHAAGKLSQVTDKSALMVRWARVHPKSALGTPESAHAVARYLHAREETHTAVRRRLASRVRTDYQRNVERPVDPTEFDPLIDGLIDQVPSTAWFLMVSSQGDDDANDLFEQLASTIVQIAAQTELVDYLAIVWVELLVRLQHRTDQEESDEDPPIAYLLVQLSAKDNGSRDVIHLMASTDAVRFAALRADLDEVVQTSQLGVQTFDQFWRFAAGGSGDLGMYYIGFLEEVCGRLGVGLKTFAQGNGNDGRLNMVVTF